MGANIGDDRRDFPGAGRAAFAVQKYPDRLSNLRTRSAGAPSCSFGI